MDRRHKDMVRISEILGDRYEEKKKRSAFLVLTDEEGVTMMACGGWRVMFDSVIESLAETMAKNAKPGIDINAMVDTYAEELDKVFRKDLLQHLRERFEAPDLSIQIQDLEEKLRKALLGED